MPIESTNDILFLDYDTQLDIGLLILTEDDWVVRNSDDRIVGTKELEGSLMTHSVLELVLIFECFSLLDFQLVYGPIVSECFLYLQ